MVTEVSGNPHLQEDELDEFIWWNTQEPVPVYAHVKYILTRLPSEYRHLVTGIEQLV